jgi:hypothetical protein
MEVLEMIDLWPNDIAFTGVKAPVSILKEQASLLGEKTKNLLKAEVRLSEPDLLDTQSVMEKMFGLRQFYYAFYFVAPTLNNYRYKLFTISHGIQLYPVQINIDDDIKFEVLGKNTDGIITASSEEEFIEILKKVFNASKTKKIMQSILAQTEFEPA